MSPLTDDWYLAKHNWIIHFPRKPTLHKWHSNFQSQIPTVFWWLARTNWKVAELTNKDLYKLALAKSQGSFSRTISSFLPSMGWSKIRQRLHYNFGSVATKQHAASMLIDQQQKTSKTLQEYVQRFSDLLLKSSSLLPHQAKDLAYITHFICNLHNQKLQHYVLGKTPTSVQNTITLAQKKDTELWIIEGIHNNDSDLGINDTSSNKQYQSKSSSSGPCHSCSGPYLIRDCEDSVCKK